MINFLAVDPIIIHIIWAVIAILMIVIEFFTFDFTSIWFGVGAIVALILSLCGVSNFVIQFATFLGVSVLLLLCLRKVLKKFFIKKTVATNTDSLIGEKVLVLKGCDAFNVGEGKIKGLIWSIICENEDKCETDDFVTVVKIVGNKLVVKK